MKTTVCKDCPTTIVWALTRTGKRAPIEATPHESGNVRLEERSDGTVLAHYLSREQILAALDADEDAVFYRSHFVSCPAAKQRRRLG